MNVSSVVSNKKASSRRKWFKIPVGVVHEMLQNKSVRPLERYLEDVELVNNTELIDSLIEAKKDLEAGKGIPWEEIKEKYDIA
ncbi:hypothetical protein FJZ31_14125 [Candidatus Poribacteria bacterium]|nr:hypothetical protein [Candidatus Poribacteria bacterium]